MSNENKRILFMGDSLVSGFPYRRTLSFPSIISEKLGVTVYNEGSNGETAAFLSRYFAREVKRLKPDLVFIMAGSNDVMEPDANAEAIAETLLDMAQAAVRLGSTPVLLTPIANEPSLAAERWMRGVNYERANKLMAHIGRILLDSEYRVIDMGTLYAQCGEYTDGVHPTPAGYRYMADLIMDSGIIQGEK